jgi:hypothetical protein
LQSKDAVTTAPIYLAKAASQNSAKKCDLGLEGPRSMSYPPDC